MASSAIETKAPANQGGTTFADPTRPELSSTDSKIRQLPVSLNTLRSAAKLFDLLALYLLVLGCMSALELNILSLPLGMALPWLLYPVICYRAIKVAGGYRMVASRQIWTQIRRVFIAILVASGLSLIAIWIVYGGSVLPSYSPLLALGIVLLSGLHAYYVGLIKHFFRTGQLSENVVIVGATERAQKLIERNRSSNELNIVGMFDDRLDRVPQSIAGIPLLGRLDDLLLWDKLPEIDRVIVTVTSDARSRVRQLIDRLRVLPNRIVLLLDLDGFCLETESLAEIAHSPAAYVSGSPDDTSRAIIKRFADIGFASLMLVGFLPIILVVAVAIKLDSKGPILFRQQRHGFNNQIIRVWKFRSMRDDPEAAQRMSAQTTENDPRVTRIGRFIRATSLDELPQLINVLTGSMSIVGPRPHAIGMTSEDTDVQAIVREYAHRHRVKPGITGWAQINGSRGPVPTKELVRERVRLDMEYINRASFWFDLYIMLMTAPVLLGDRQNQR
ncbi:MAG: exopolysaccharide biosynthesis polyprenyl glycosylphosphotransferase [Pseudomonadota bacterium]